MTSGRRIRVLGVDDDDVGLQVLQTMAFGCDNVANDHLLQFPFVVAKGFVPRLVRE